MAVATRKPSVTALSTAGAPWDFDQPVKALAKMVFAI